jgi:hypothetical protein
MLFLVRNPRQKKKKKEVWGGALWCNNRFFWHQSSGRSLRLFSRSHLKGHINMRNWLFRTNSLWTIPLMPKKIMSVLLALLFYLSHLSRARCVCTCHSNTRIRHTVSFPNAWIVIALFPRFSETVMLFRFRIHREIALCPIHDFK